MKKFEVTVQEVHSYVVEIEAGSAEEAERIVGDMDYGWSPPEPEFDYTLSIDAEEIV